MEDRLNTCEQIKKTMSDEEDCGEKGTGERLGRDTELLWDSKGAPRDRAEEKEPASQTRAPCLRAKKMRGDGEAGRVRP